MGRNRKNKQSQRKPNKRKVKKTQQRPNGKQSADKQKIIKLEQELKQTKQERDQERKEKTKLIEITHTITTNSLDRSAKNAKLKDEKEEEVAKFRDKLAKFGEKYQPLSTTIFNTGRVLAEIFLVIAFIFGWLGEDRREKIKDAVICKIFANCSSQEEEVITPSTQTQVFPRKICHNYLPHSPSPSSVDKYCGTMKQLDELNDQ